LEQERKDAIIECVDAKFVVKRERKAIARPASKQMVNQRRANELS